MNISTLSDNSGGAFVGLWFCSGFSNPFFNGRTPKISSSYTDEPHTLWKLLQAKKQNGIFYRTEIIPVLPIAEQNSRDILKCICFYVYLFHDLGGPRWHSG